ncbi:unnamed protein product, partial [Discosporangium mesarthrocarpum]
QVGKSSVCLGLLGSLLRLGLNPSEVCYIKPATQCEMPQLVTTWCKARGVACRGIGPVVFYKGFTREFLKGALGTSEDLLEEIKEAVHSISKGKQVAVIDGVGYPAVGSICGVSNADVASALGSPVVLVGKPGVGDAVDSFNLNAAFFEVRGLQVLGGIFNRLSPEGFYSRERCQEAVTSYFEQSRPAAMPYGFVPDVPCLKMANETAPLPTPARAHPSENDNGKSKAAAQVDGKGREGGGVVRVDTEASLAELKTSSGFVLVDFGAEWCRNCKSL